MTDCKQIFLVDLELSGEARLLGGNKDIGWIEAQSFNGTSTRNIIYFVCKLTLLNDEEKDENGQILK